MKSIRNYWRKFTKLSILGMVAAALLVLGGGYVVLEYLFPMVVGSITGEKVPTGATIGAGTWWGGETGVDSSDLENLPSVQASAEKQVFARFLWALDTLKTWVGGG